MAQAYEGIGGNVAPNVSGIGTGTRKLNFLGWGVLLLALYAFNGTRTGHEMIFYSLVLIVLFLFIYNYQAILNVLTKKE